MTTIATLLVLVPALPLLAAAVTAALGPRILRERSHIPVVAAIGLSCLASLVLLWEVHGKAQAVSENQIGYAETVTLWTWADVQEAYMTGPKALGSSSPGHRPGDRNDGRHGRRPNGPTVLLGEGLGRWPDNGILVGLRPQGARLGWKNGAPSGQRTFVASVQNGDESIAQTIPNLVRRTHGPYDFDIQITLRADALTAMMLAMVTFVSFLVAVYSIGYMHGDRGYWRFFSYIGLFVFSMTMLVSVSNFLLLYVFWEAVGLCSYLLIGFWYEKPSAAAAGKKAFLVNRIGDFGFALGIFLIWTCFGTLNFHDVPDTPGVLGQTLLEKPELYHAYLSGGLATVVCLLLMLGACGKSAQFPLHVWLPDAMEGPSPVSALIHAATMVTAGVYMVARLTPLFLLSADARMTVAAIGGFTAAMAAVIAVTQTDLKRILAYSTISQLGYMFLGVGVGSLLGVTAGMFHLLTHAFFKALLFLGAGSVMHATGGVIDLRRFGGLRRRMPTTYWTFLFGCLALSGFPLFSGFFSKDEILAAVHEHGGTFYETLYWVGMAAAAVTAFYTFRAFFLAFHGEEKIPEEAASHGGVHESPRSMTVPLVILAVGAAVVGGWFFVTGGLTTFLQTTPSLDPRIFTEHAEHATAAGSHADVMLISSLVALAGIALAWLLYPGRETLVRRLAWLADRVGLYRLSYHKFFFDEIYTALVVWPLAGLAGLCGWFDREVIDGLVNAVGRAPLVLGATLRPSQGGLIPSYALAMLLGLLLLLGVLFW